MSDDSDSSREGSREPEAKEGKSEEIFEVEKILNHKVEPNNELFLQVRWVGYDESEDTWEPEEDLQECAKKVVGKYYKSLGVQNRSELIKKVKQEAQKKQKSNASKPKKREKSPSPISEKEDSEAESDDSYTKETPAKKKKKRNDKTSTSSASSTPKVQTKAAVKAYSSQSAAKAPVTPVTNSAKRLAQGLRSAMWESSDDDDDDEQQISEIDKIASKVKPNVDVAQASVKPAVPIEVSNPVETPTASPIPRATSPPLRAASKNVKAPKEAVNGCEKPSTSKDQKEAWTVEGIAKSTKGTNEKLILVKSSISGERKVLSPEEAFKLCGWDLTEYLLHHCEF